MSNDSSGGPSSWGDAELARRCAVVPPDQLGWEELWGRFYRLVRWRIRSVDPGLPDGEVEEVVIRTFQRVFETIGRYNPARGHGHLGPFILKIAENLARDERRKHRLEPAQTAPEEEIQAPNLTIPFDFLAELMDAVRPQLNEKQVSVFNAFGEGMTIPEVVAALGLSETTVRRIKNECVQLVLKAIDRVLPTVKKK
jgi:RNA polymerase sigma factor (sigma-70 family)